MLRATKGLVFVGVLCCYNLGGPKTASYVTVRGGSSRSSSENSSRSRSSISNKCQDSSSSSEGISSEGTSEGSGGSR